MAVNKGRIPLKNHRLMWSFQYRGRMAALPFSFYEETERDGNCFYTSLAKAVFSIVATDEKARKEFLDFVELFKMAEVPWAVYECYIETIEEALSTHSSFYEVEQAGKAQVFVGYLRLLLSSHITCNKNDYRGFMVNETLENYIKTKIDPMGQRAGEFEIAAISSILKYKIIVYDITSHQKDPTIYGDGSEIFILHSPDHFEPLYKNC